MTPTDHHTIYNTRRDNITACSIISFCVGWLCLMLGWAQGVRKDTTFLGIPETRSWLIATAVFVVLGILFFLWSRAVKRS